MVTANEPVLTVERLHNQTIVVLDAGMLLFSYETLVAFRTNAGTVAALHGDWSQTTNRHLHSFNVGAKRIAFVKKAEFHIGLARFLQMCSTSIHEPHAEIHEHPTKTPDHLSLVDPPSSGSSPD
jgi:hypothetical protein